MDRKVIDALLETVNEMMLEQYGKPFEKLFDAFTLELLSTGAIRAAAFDRRVTEILQGADFAAAGTRLLLRVREIARLHAKGQLKETRSRSRGVKARRRSDGKS